MESLMGCLIRRVARVAMTVKSVFSGKGIVELSEYYHPRDFRSSAHIKCPPNQKFEQQYRTPRYPSIAGGSSK